MCLTLEDYPWEAVASVEDKVIMLDIATGEKHHQLSFNLYDIATHTCKDKPILTSLTLPPAVKMIDRPGNINFTSRFLPIKIDTIYFRILF